MPARHMSAAVELPMRFVYEWERGEGVVAPELAATWARLELWVDDNCITQVEDLDSGSARRSIYVSLYPLAEWIAFNWWRLKANVRPAALVSAPASLPQYRSSAARRCRRGWFGVAEPGFIGFWVAAGSLRREKV